MPRPEINDYTFYKIVNINNDVDLCYVGSTCNMKQRRYAHKNACNNVSNPRHNCKVYTTIREHGGWDEFKIIELGYVEQITLTEAHIIEEEYRVELKANLNTYKCIPPKEGPNIYYHNRKEVYQERGKIYRETHKQEISAWQNTKILCECGCSILKPNKAKHRKSPKHINLMNAKTD